MKVSNTADRLKHIMSERNLKQVDIVTMCKPYCVQYGVKMNKSDISQYVSGKSEPSQDKLVVLAMALNVQESWLMGFDVPENREKPATGEGDELTKEKQALMQLIIDCPEDKAATLLQVLQLFLDSERQGG